MRAVVLTADRPALEATEVADPRPAADDVLLRVIACGICGSDLHIAAQIGPVGGILGHEIAATVEGVGSGVDPDRWPVGTPVAVRPLAGCGRCAWCSRGRPDHCDQFQLVGLERPGGFAELTTARADELFRLPSALTGDDQALVEPLAVARRALRRGRLAPADSVAVIGAGPIGLAVIAWAQTLGVETIVASEPAPMRRELATTLGATLAVDPTTQDLSDALHAATGGPGASAVFECSGRAGMIQQAAQLAAVDGRVVVVGICLAVDSIFPFTAIQKELDLRFALYYGREDFIDTLEALDAGGLAAAQMITDTVDLAGLPERFARLDRDTDGGKVVVRP